MSKRITDEKLNVEMSINGVNKTQAEISKIQTSIRDLKNENEALAAAKRKLLSEGKKESDQYKELTKAQQSNRVEIDKYTTRQKELQKQLGLTGMTMKQLVKQQNSLKAQMNNFVPGTPEWQKLNRELQETKARMGQVRGEMNQTEGVMGRMKKSLGGFGGMLLGGAGLMAAWQAVKKFIGANSELSDSLANVRKTTGLTEEEVNKLESRLRKFNTRTPQNELLALAEEAGRLGKDSVKDIEEFVRTADKISVSLGDDLQGDINENVQLIGKLGTQYRVSEKYGGDFGKTMERIGSAINEVASSGANQAGFLVDYLKRLAGISNQTGITADQQLGFAAALDEAGQSVEVSGTTMSKIITDMYTDASEYAKIAGVDTKEFTDLLKTDANEALLLFLEGLKGNGEGFGVMANKMKELKLEGSRSIGVLTALASNTDIVRERQLTANKGIIEATSLTDEFNVKNDNLAGTLQKIGNAISNSFKSGSLGNTLNSLIKGFGELTGLIDDNAEAFARENKQTFESAQANQRLARESSALLSEYESLTREGVIPTADEKERLEIITLRLRDRLGESVISIDKETGAFILNTEAVKEQIKQKRLAADAEASTLASRLSNTQDEIKKIKDRQKIINRDRELNRKAFEEENKENLTAIENSSALTSTEKLKMKMRLEGFQEYDTANQKLLRVNKELSQEEANRIDLITKLKDLNYSEDDINAAFGNNSEEAKEGETKTIGGQLFEFKGGQWVIKKAEGGDGEDALTSDQLAAREKRLKSLATLQERYIKMEEDRLAVSNEAKAVLERDRMVKEAEELRAGQELLNDIKAEHQIKIEEARAKDEEIELQNIQAFEERKKDLENQIALQREEDEEARDLLAQEQRYEKDQENLEKELENIEATEDQKNSLRRLLKEEHEASMFEIETRHAAMRLEKEKHYNNEYLRATEQFEAAKSNAIMGGLSTLSSFFDKKSGLYQALFLMEKGMAMAEVGNHTAKSLAEITANTAAANTKAVSASPMTFGMPWVAINTATGIKQAAAVKLNSALQMVTIGASAIKGVSGFEDGMYPDYLDVTRTDGKRFTARNMGNAGTRIVSEPSYFSDNGGYLAAENGTEMVIDNGVFRQLDPSIVQNIMEVRHKVHGYEGGMYPAQSTSGSSNATSDPELKAMIAGMMNLLQNPPRPQLVWGYEEAEKTTELQTEIEQSKNNGKLTP